MCFPNQHYQKTRCIAQIIADFATVFCLYLFYSVSGNINICSPNLESLVGNWTEFFFISFSSSLLIFFFFCSQHVNRCKYESYFILRLLIKIHSEPKFLSNKKFWMHLQTTVKHPIPKRVKAWLAHLCLKMRGEIFWIALLFICVSLFYRQAALINWCMCVDACFCVCVFRCVVSCLPYLPCLFFMTELHCRHFCGFDG